MPQLLTGSWSWAKIAQTKTNRSRSRGFEILLYCALKDGSPSPGSQVNTGRCPYRGSVPSLELERPSLNCSGMALAVLGTGPSVSTPGGRKPAAYVEARERVDRYCRVQHPPPGRVAYAVI